MDRREELLALERAFWTGDAQFFREHVAEECLIVLEGMAGRMTSDELARTVEGGPRWEDVAMKVSGTLEPGGGLVLLAYEARATRRRSGGEDERYRAQVTSGYVEGPPGTWRLAFHQQTPIR